MSGQFQADIDALTTFRDDVNALVKTINGNKALMSYIQTLGTVTSSPAGPLDFGQDLLEFTPAQDLATRYDGNYHGFMSNLQAFLNSLTVLAEAADTIANNYKNATSADQVGVADVQNAIANAPAPQQTQPS